MPEVQLPDRDALIRECGRSIACIHAVEYYIKYVQNPCYPPPDRLTTKARRYLIELVSRYGSPKCDIKALVYNALRGSKLEQFADEIAEIASKIKRELNITSRVAAALATIIVARRRRINVTKYKVAKAFSVSANSLNEYKIRDALKVITLGA
jgi:hypothetical protein